MTLPFKLLAFGLGSAGLAFVMSRPAFFRRCVGSATPGTLGAIRAWVCAILLVNVVQERLSTIAWLPPDLRLPMGVMKILHALPLGLDQLVLSAAGLRAFQWLTGAALLLGMIGWRARLVVPLAAAMSMTLFGILREYSFFWHQNLVAIYVLGVLVFTPCGDGWSVDRLRRIARGQPVPAADRPAAVYGWSRYACWVAVAMPYMAAGMSKFRNGGWAWWAPQNMRRFLYGDTLNPVHFDWNFSLRLAEAPDALFAALGFAGAWGEALFGLVLVSWWARKLFPLVMAGTHLGIIFLQNILFLDLIMLQAIFFDFSPARRRLERWLAPKPREPPRFAAPADETVSARHSAPVAALILGLFFCWLFRVEFYPLTAMQMYTEPWRMTDEIYFSRSLAHPESGAPSTALFRKAVGTLAINARYRPIMKKCFRSPDQVALCERFLQATGAGFNQTAPPGERIARFEIQRWATTAQDPRDQRIVGRLLIDVPASESKPR